MKDFPYELLLSTFSFLKPEERTNVNLTCNEWYQVNKADNYYWRRLIQPNYIEQYKNSRLTPYEFLQKNPRALVGKNHGYLVADLCCNVTRLNESLQVEPAFEQGYLYTNLDAAVKKADFMCANSATDFYYPIFFVKLTKSALFKPKRSFSEGELAAELVMDYKPKHILSRNDIAFFYDVYFKAPPANPESERSLCKIELNQINHSSKTEERRGWSCNII